MSAEEFVSALQDMNVRLRRMASGDAGRRRAAREVVRRRRRWFMRVHGLSSLPEIEVGALSFDALVGHRDPEKLRIVIPSRSDAADREAGTMRPGQLRKDMRRLLFEASRKGLDPFDLVGTRRNHRHLPAIGRARRETSVASRSLYLEALGIAIMPDLNDAEIAALEDAGAQVLANEKIVIDDPRQKPSARIAPVSPSHLKAISIATARELGLTGKGVTIGVLDTGIDVDHPEFAGKRIHFAAFKEGGQRRKVEARDFGFHGTHVSALAAGREVGVAPDADLAVAAVLTTRNGKGQMVGYRTQIVAGLNWLADGHDFDRPIDVLNASFGSHADPAKYHTEVNARREAGLLTIASIGNDGEKGMDHHTAPGKLACAVAVGAVDDDGIIAPFSDWGQCYARPDPLPDFKPDIMAPGVEVESAVPKGGYGRSSGTSMAAPLVTGACALLIEADETLRRSPDRLTGAVLSLCTPLPTQPNDHDERRGGKGRLNLAGLGVYLSTGRRPDGMER